MLTIMVFNCLLKKKRLRNPISNNQNVTNYQSPYGVCGEVPKPEPCYPGTKEDCNKWSYQDRMPFLMVRNNLKHT